MSLMFSTSVIDGTFVCGAQPSTHSARGSYSQSWDRLCDCKAFCLLVVDLVSKYAIVVVVSLSEFCSYTNQFARMMDIPTSTILISNASDDHRCKFMLYDDSTALASFPPNEMNYDTTLTIARVDMVCVRHHGHRLWRRSQSSRRCC